ncbi:hypothetical protein HMPREF1981_03512 [Bacteroides pyogenes F0041]|uniref:Uncharacterized protein n=1 Tax=Bacteroides pyogenes F0041 TaxID=1321819 RepID=U2DML6_9BACE|nr:hypothetical protein HMPREF1981_03512 [Bacteroides pyogenes F0041]MBB3896234.1 hypothetical protein [Bacteroides pyogenes]GAE23335.1 hypothetical protein JCM10003_3078 [Bacteroides pyogenes JCM 10003]
MTCKSLSILTNNHFYLHFLIDLFGNNKKGLTFANKKLKYIMIALHTSINLAILHIIRVVVVSSGM